MKPAYAGALALAVLAGAGALAAGIVTRPAPPADERQRIDAGYLVYRDRCAGCHGRNLEGQPLWSAHDALSWRRAPPLGAAGRAWQHTGGDLAHKIATGRYPDEPAGTRVAMPAYAGRLSAAEMASVLAFMRSRWPPGIRFAQASVDPTGRGSAAAPPPGWTFPARCRGRS